jgi:hypothetical protein
VRPEKRRVEEARAQGELILGEPHASTERDARTAEVGFGEVSPSIGRQRSRVAFRVGVRGQAHPQVAHDDRVALDDVDDEDDFASLGALAKGQVHALEEPGAEEPVSQQLQLGVVDVYDVTGAKLDVAEHDALARTQVAANLDALELIAKLGALVVGGGG